MYKAFIFDLDGTICDTIETIAYYGNYTLNKYGFKSIDTDEYKYLVGDGADTLIRRMLSRYGVKDERLIGEILEFYMTEYEKDSLYKTKAFAGIEDVIRQLKKENIKTGVVSNKPHGAVCKVVEAIFGKDVFDSYTGVHDGIVKKPNPETVLRMAESFGVTTKQCVYIGDTSVDMLTGKNAGMFTVGVLWGFREYGELKENGADMIVKTPQELLRLV